MASSTIMVSPAFTCCPSLATILKTLPAVPHTTGSPFPLPPDLAAAFLGAGAAAFAGAAAAAGVYMYLSKEPEKPAKVDAKNNNKPAKKK
jgi:hypothetical protein